MKITLDGEGASGFLAYVARRLAAQHIPIKQQDGNHHGERHRADHDQNLGSPGQVGLFQRDISFSDSLDARDCHCLDSASYPRSGGNPAASGRLHRRPHPGASGP